ncbi:hypothetical protein [Candidatus Methanomassiliicoccus intestinalis]|uniref:Uncharacterized protein n=1 Tax=Methanomassiliicoccus intestinalis (strain Issoire-Mx1) TaxID=1295009 RepID=R9T4Z1_METII|nr:hypothetical protein [Candidatus Methanomassiliicoccus intestinalis]AGN25775.1 hypothetical protein MMINT_03900 [Candidatus Methanomassiliicoccus intestinalis Issoire-Mx1]
MKEIPFDNFINNISEAETPFAVKIDNMLLQGNCLREIKEGASGYSVTYKSSSTKKTVAAFVCRKTGLKIRITPPKPFSCDDLCADLPDNMKKDMKRGNDCKRLSDASVCNQRCLMGYTFTIDDKLYQKCRSMAFLFSVTEENMPYITKFIQKGLGIETSV